MKLSNVIFLCACFLQATLAGVKIDVINETSVKLNNVNVTYHSEGGLFNWNSDLVSAFSLQPGESRTVDSYDGWFDGQHGIYYVGNKYNVSAANRCNMKKDGVAVAHIQGEYELHGRTVYDISWDCSGGDIITGQATGILFHYYFPSIREPMAYAIKAI